MGEYIVIRCATCESTVHEEWMERFKDRVTIVVPECHECGYAKGNSDGYDAGYDAGYEEGKKYG